MKLTTALRALIASIEGHTDDAGKVDREALDPWIERVESALDAHKKGVRKADAWLVERTNGTKEVVLAPITDDTHIGYGDEAWPLYKDNLIEEGTV